MGGDVFRAGAPGDTRLDGAGIDRDRVVEARAGIGGERAPIRDRRIPVRALRRHRTAFEPVEHHIVGRDETGARARLDAHVADGEPALDAHLLEHAAAVFDDMAGAAGRAERADDVQDEVLGSDPGTEAALDPYLERF